MRRRYDPDPDIDRQIRRTARWCRRHAATESVRAVLRGDWEGRRKDVRDAREEREFEEFLRLIDGREGR